MSNTIEAEDRASYDAWKLAETLRFERDGGATWWSSRKAMSKRRGATPPADAFAGPYWVAKSWLSSEAIDWFEEQGHARYTWQSWQAKMRDERAAIASDEIAAADGVALDMLEYIREMNGRRGEYIAAARSTGTPWADITAALGMSRAQCHTLAADYAAARLELAADADYVPTAAEMEEAF